MESRGIKEAYAQKHVHNDIQHALVVTDADSLLPFIHSNMLFLI